jgi:3-phytase
MAGFYSGNGEGQRLLGETRENVRKPQKTSKRTLMAIVALMGVVVLATGYSRTETVYESHSTTEVSRALHDQAATSPLSSSKSTLLRGRTCNTVNGGYQCNPTISHQWGQYSPYFSLSEESAISDDVPGDCQVTFVQVLSRHGARFPSAPKSKKYGALIDSIQANATAYKGKTAFLRSYEYKLGSEDLTAFGERQMVDSGLKFYRRYEQLTRNGVPFIRSSDSDRVVQSGEYFIKGFQHAKSHDKDANHRQPSPGVSVIISEAAGSNNTLNHADTCTNFENSSLGDDVINNYTAIFWPSIRTRLEADLPGVALADGDVTNLMDMCPFDTVSQSSNPTTVSPFCDLFTETEWTQYNYLQSLNKYYGYGAGNPLGPTQGVGYVNELIARLMHTPIHDDTTTNHTLDAPGAATFPLNYTMYADFTHDNGMIPIFFALGLYNSTATLPRTHLQAPDKADGYSAAWTVPFAARAYIEMMQCRSDPNPEPFVRILVNDRVVPLHGCSVDSLGRCCRRDFVNGLSFARSGGKWHQCFD